MTPYDTRRPRLEEVLQRVRDRGGRRVEPRVEEHARDAPADPDTHTPNE